MIWWLHIRTCHIFLVITNIPSDLQQSRGRPSGRPNGTSLQVRFRDIVYYNRTEQFGRPQYVYFVQTCVNFENDSDSVSCRMTVQQLDIVKGFIFVLKNLPRSIYQNLICNRVFQLISISVRLLVYLLS